MNDLSAFEPAPGLRNPHAQTIVGRIVRRRFEPRYDRVRLDTDDGDFVDLDVWRGLEAPSGLCLLLHGLEGSAHSGYMVTTSEALAAAGIQAVALNFRSCSGEPNRLPGAYHSGRTDDIERALDWMAARFPGLPRAAVGFSLGGNALLNLLGREGGGRSLVAAAAVSVPYDLESSADALQRGMGRVYGRRFLRSLREKAREKALRFPDVVAPGAARARTLREFDDRLTAPIHGFRDAADYYARCSAKRFVDPVDLPMLLIHARDDPLAPGSSVPVETIRRRPNLSLALTERGGHLGFVGRGRGMGRAGARAGARTGWLEETVTRYISRAMHRTPHRTTHPDSGVF
ncbi:MAG: alpha/beta fold hydrolase [Gemmatimonadota bacterium]|uniref:YheT family hydrolase n=1 Tax=Candidatus Palauibacter scopulicola TaxID=3056741 RepID=UPI0023896E36|nr:alpha/beta fold hydrolase [Candidatus Palauibacter scopulicola]MDE2662269.1 alpha/beta fold hydrolase [Candidatus Palauibacter scopulicola]